MRVALVSRDEGMVREYKNLCGKQYFGSVYRRQEIGGETYA